jgi:hypothetical protein
MQNVEFETLLEDKLDRKRPKSQNFQNFKGLLFHPI